MLQALTTWIRPTWRVEATRGPPPAFWPSPAMPAIRTSLTSGGTRLVAGLALAPHHRHQIQARPTPGQGPSHSAARTRSPPAATPTTRPGPPRAEARGLLRHHAWSWRTRVEPPLFVSLPTWLRSVRSPQNRLICRVEPVRIAVVCGEARNGRLGPPRRRGRRRLGSCRGAVIWQPPDPFSRVSRTVR